jgi:glycerol uptake facilitator protein
VGGRGQAILAETAGTFVVVLFGVGSVHVAVLTGALTGLWQVAIVWGLAVTLAIYATAARSGAHLNPAVTVAMAVHRGFPWLRVPTYLAAQVAGAFAAAALLMALFGGFLNQFEAARGIVRGAAGSERSAMIFGEYFPNPGAVTSGVDSSALVTLGQAAWAEGLGTAVLVFVIFLLTDERNRARPMSWLVPPFIGLCVTMIICVVAPLTQAGLNPARDFGPRLFAWMAGWGEVAIPGPRGGFFVVYILAPVLGGVAGGGLQRVLFAESETEREAPANCAARSNAEVQSARSSPCLNR